MTAEVVKHVEAAELGLEDEDEEDVGTKDRALGEAAADRCDRCDLWFCPVTYRRPLRQDHAIDYNEFMQLFPVRVQRMRELKDLQA